ncbi:MAG TPA: NUDIX hydrolase [Blastocatellia bacterium]|nr:NUDIX hydrolase [Blastocatellia bacterium]
MKKEKAQEKHCYDHPRPAVTVDIVLFHRANRGARILLIRRKHEPFKGRWAFPGGFVDADEALEAAAARELHEETGLTGIELQQIGAFGDPGRDPRGHTISVVFGALLENQPQPSAADDAEAAAWHSASNPPPLAFDHKTILRTASARILGNRRRRNKE